MKGMAVIARTSTEDVSNNDQFIVRTYQNKGPGRVHNRRQPPLKTAPQRSPLIQAPHTNPMQYKPNLTNAENHQMRYTQLHIQAPTP